LKQKSKDVPIGVHRGAQYRSTLPILSFTKQGELDHRSMAESPLDRLVPDVVDLRIDGAELPEFAVREELEELINVVRIGALKSTTLCCARLLEALCIMALDRAQLPYSPNVFSNLDTLQQYNLIPAATRYWAHALRRLGNDVRHLIRPIGADDACLAVIFVERNLEWYFCRFRFGPRLRHLTCDEAPLGIGSHEELSAVADAFDLEEFDPCALAQNFVSQLGVAAHGTPVFAAALAEHLLDGDHDADARRVLDLGRDRFPDDPRLNQLWGLYWSRRGDLQRACEILEPLYRRFPNDPETVGITAGLYKRLWRADINVTRWLKKSHQAYFAAWRSSKKVNSYVGINAATTALWLGNLDDACQIAADVRDRLLERLEMLSSHHDDSDLVFNYWEHVTLAEAHLLLDERDSAQRVYEQVFQKYAQQRANIGVSRKQGIEILKAKGFSDEAAELWFVS
jgi:hypothetical protein